MPTRFRLFNHPAIAAPPHLTAAPCPSPDCCPLAGRAALELRLVELSATHTHTATTTELTKLRARVVLLGKLGNSGNVLSQAVASAAALEAEKSELQDALKGWTFPK